jgi:hypothetical protein
LLSVVATSACLGDQGIQVYFRNETGMGISVYPDGRQYPASRQLMAPGEQHKDALQVSSTKPDAFVARIEAVDATGTLIYCHRFTYGELERLAGVIRIRVGDNTC